MRDNELDVRQFQSKSNGADRLASPGTAVGSAEPTELGELEAVELELEGYRTEIHHAHDRIDPATYGVGYSNSRNASRFTVHPHE